MIDVLLAILGFAFYVSELLVWPACALLWRGTGKRTRALRRVFFTQLFLLLVLVGFAVFSRGLLEHPYGWLFLMLVLNVVFTPLALGAAVYDSSRAARE